MSLRRRPRLHHRCLPRIGELALRILAAERHQPSLSPSCSLGQLLADMSACAVSGTVACVLIPGSVAS